MSICTENHTHSLLVFSLVSMSLYKGKFNTERFPEMKHACQSHMILLQFFPMYKLLLKKSLCVLVS